MRHLLYLCGAGGESTATMLFGNILVAGRTGLRDCVVSFSVHLLYALIIYFDKLDTCRNDHTKMTAPHPVRSAKLSIFGSVSTTVGDHVGILSIFFCSFDELGGVWIVFCLL